MWSMVKPEKAAPVTGTTLRTGLLALAGKLSAVNAESVRNDPMTDGINKWRSPSKSGGIP